MPFHDFEIRAWVVGRTQAAVVVHSSPAGAMQRPETVSLDRNRLSPFLDIFAGSSKIETEVIVGLVAAGGRELGSILFPEQVIGMLIRSLERIDPECGSPGIQYCGLYDASTGEWMPGTVQRQSCSACLPTDPFCNG